MKHLIPICLLLLFIFPDNLLAKTYQYVNANGRTVYSNSPGPDEHTSRNDNRSGFKFSRSKEKTAEDIPLDFTPEKTEYRRGKLLIWGNVKNKLNGRPYRFVKVTFSLWGGRGGTLMAREYLYTDPTTIGPGQIGYILGYAIDCDVEQLNLIEYQVTGQ